MIKQGALVHVTIEYCPPNLKYKKDQANAQAKRMCLYLLKQYPFHV